MKAKPKKPATKPAAKPRTVEVRDHDVPMKIEVWNLDKIIPYPNNARIIPDSAVRKVADSINAYGWRQPIVVDVAGVIVAGQLRRLAALQLGLICTRAGIALPTIQ